MSVRPRTGPEGRPGRPRVGVRPGGLPLLARWVLACLLLTGLAVPAWGTGASTPTPVPASTPEPTPTPAVTPPLVPGAVDSWFDTDAPEAARAAGLSATDPDAFAVGAPRQVATWAAEFVAGDTAAQPATFVDEWVAPVSAPPAAGEAPALVAVVWAQAEGGTSPELVSVLPDTDLAAALAELLPSVVVVRDPDVEGWFAIAEGEVWPLSAGARGVLQGSLDVDIFQGFLTQRLGGATAAPTPPVASEEADTLTPLLPIAVILLLGAGAAWLLARQYRRADSRIAADVRAGVSPPRLEDAGVGPVRDGPTGVGPPRHEETAP